MGLLGNQNRSQLFDSSIAAPISEMSINQHTDISMDTGANLLTESNHGKADKNSPEFEAFDAYQHVNIDIVSQEETDAKVKKDGGSVFNIIKNENRLSDLQLRANSGPVEE